MREFLQTAGAMLLGGVCLLPLAGRIAHADEFPSRPVEIVIGFAQGGIVDNSVRVMTEELSRSLGVAVVVTNKAGGGGAVGAEYVANARADGYVILASTVGVFNIVPLLNPGLRYKLSDFIPLARYANSPTVFVVKRDSPYRKFEDLVSYARKNPGKLTGGVPGVGTATDFSLEMMKLEAGINFLTIPYKGGGDLNAALLGGHLDFITIGSASALGLAKGGNVRVLGINAGERDPSFPDVPSLKELGYPRSVLRIGVGYFLPTGTPRPVVDKLGAVFEKVIKTQAVKKSLGNLGNMVDYEDSAAFARSLAEEIKVLEEVGRTAKLIK